MFRKAIGLNFSRRQFIRNIHNTNENEVLFDYINKIGIIKLNKPKTLNALTFSINQKLRSKIKEWQSDGKTQLIIIKSTDSKAFSAGGDIKALSTKASDGNQYRNNYLQNEYQLIYQVGTSKIPIVALISGITMGGGCGISVPGPFRVATETTIVAMPEAAIGLFPDAGGSYYLSRLSNNLGIFLGLTGYRLRGTDVVYAGMGTHFIPNNRLEEVQQQLIQLSKFNHQSVKEILDKNSEPVKSFSLQEQLPLINRVFSPNVKNVETIVEELKSDGSPFALKQLSMLQKMSPTSLKITLEQLKRGKHLDLKHSLKMEYSILQTAMNHHDFYEGARAVFIDKDNQPRWQPNSLETVSNEYIAKCFDRLPSDKELQLLD